MTVTAGQDGERRLDDGRSRQQNVSLSPAEWLALRLLAGEERYGHISKAVASLIDGEMTARFGREWRSAAPLDPSLLDARGMVA